MDSKEKNNQKKEYLKQYRSAIKQELILSDEIERIRFDVILPNVINDGMPHGSGYSDLSEYAAKLDKAVTALKQQRLKKIKLYTDIQKKILCIENDTEKSLLILKYLQGKTWEQVASDLNYSWKGIHKVHERALQHFNL